MRRRVSFQLALISPVYNEQEILLARANLIKNQMDKLLGSEQWLHIFIDNGSEDNTPEILHGIVKNSPQHKFIRIQNPDFGEALRTGLLAAETPWAYVLPIDEWDIQFLTWAWRNKDKYDLVIGSKRADLSINQQSFYRRLLSWGLNTALKLLFGYLGTDTHGGKLIRQEALRPIINHAEMRRGQFDTEVVLKSFRAGLSIAEAPAAHSEIRPPRNLMAMKIFRNVIDLWRLLHVMKKVPYQKKPSYRRLSRVDVLKANT